VKPDNTAQGPNGGAQPSRWFPSARPPFRFLLSRNTAYRQGTRLAALTARQLRRAPGVPGSWTRFLIAHARWIAAVTLVVVAGAGALAHSQTPQYRSEADVVVEPPAALATTLQAPDMATEKGIVSSGVVLAVAAHSLQVPQAELVDGLSVTVPASTFLLQIDYSDPNPYVAQQRAQAIAHAYVSYRSVEQTPAQPSGTTSAKKFSTAPTAAVVTGASLPTSPYSPNYLIDIGVALIVGLALGIGTAGLRDHLDDHVRGPLDVQEQAGAPVLGLIPAFRPVGRSPAGWLAMATRPDSIVAEAYRGLRTRLVQSAAARDARTVVVTSPAWEDKATVVANLATALAQSGRSTIVVCTDLRWGGAHEIFGVEDRDGLARLLDRRANPVTVLCPTGIPGLHLLPPGPLTRDPAALLQRPALRTVLGDLRRHADVVIIEAPPLLASPDADALAGIADMVLLVVDARQSTRNEVRSAVREAGQVRAKLAGCVISNLGRRRRLPKPRGLQPTPEGYAGPEPPPYSPATLGHDVYDPSVTHGHNQTSRANAALAGHMRPMKREDDR
jgi:succinoglycan biosynthesis transport protein ExoP